MPLCRNSDLNLNTGLDVDDDLLDNLGRGVQVDKALVDAHLICVPGLRTLTARSLTGGDLQVLGRKTDGALDAEFLVLSAVDELLADLCKALLGWLYWKMRVIGRTLEGLDVTGGEGNSDLVDLGRLAEVLFLV
jgi:hypothetical protein